MSDAAELIADFLNSRDSRAFGEHASHPEVDEFETPEALKRWLVERKRLTASQTVSAREHGMAVRLRDGLRALLRQPGDNDAEMADAVARALPLTVSLHGRRPQLAGPGAGVRGYLAEVLSALVRAEAEGSWPLIKMCAADDCQWVFVDRSRNHMARWCATSVCGNRVKTRRYRERLRGGAVAADRSADPVVHGSRNR